MAAFLLKLSTLIHVIKIYDYCSLSQNLAAERTYGNLDVTLREALGHRAEV